MDLLSALYQQFDPAKALTAEEEDLYVNWQAKFGPSDVKKLLANSISRSGDVPITKLFSGHRGVGKSTELKRVQSMLEAGVGGRRMFVSFFEAERWVDLQDVQATDMVYGIIRQLTADLKEVGCGFALESTQQFFAEIRDLLKTELAVKDLKVKSEVLDVGIVLKEVPAARSKIRMLLQNRLPSIFDLVNSRLLTRAREWLKKPENGAYDDLVIIVDELDRIPQRVLNDQGLTNHENIFLDSAGILRSLQCDILYTIPIELAYSTSRQRLRGIYGSDILTLPVIPVMNRKGDIDKRGVDALRSIIARRTARADLKLSDLFATDEAVERLCLNSGGHVRNLFILIRSALDYSDTLPMSEDVITYALKREANSIALPLGQHQWDILREVHKTKRPPAEPDMAWYGLLRDLFVFFYEDAQGYWYDWNPLLAELDAI
jgi:hypothetical protein